MFIKAKVDGQSLLRLNDPVLRTMGVDKLGDRKRLLRCIKRINSSCCFLDQGIPSILSPVPSLAM